MGDTNKGGKFRRKTGYSVISNVVAMDSRLSLKAKGLYMLIQTYITIPGFTLYKNFLITQCIEGKSAFNAAWNELKSYGYLLQYRMRDAEKRQFYYEYELLDEPISQSTEEKKMVQEPVPENRYAAIIEPVPENRYAAIIEPVPDFEAPQKPVYGFCGTSKLGSYNQTIPSHSIPSHSISNHIISGTKETVARVKEQIAFDDLVTASMVDADLLNEIVSLIAEVYDTIDSDTIRIQKRGIKAYYVKQKFASLESKHIIYIADKIRQSSSDVRNPKAYVLTMLYNAPSTMETEMQLRVARDIGVGKPWP